MAGVGVTNGKEKSQRITNETSGHKGTTASGTFIQVSCHSFLNQLGKFSVSFGRYKNNVEFYDEQIIQASL
jgi:site-specific DNA-adenine methylase